VFHKHARAQTVGQGARRVSSFPRRTGPGLRRRAALCLQGVRLGIGSTGQGCWLRRASSADRHVQVAHLGVHVFRHSFATTQLEQGMPLKVIGDILGHQDCKTTAVYVRSAVGRLRPLALPVPK
jgi:integrase